MERTQTAALRLADATAGTLERLYGRPGFVPVASTVVAAANTTAVALVDAGLAGELTRARRELVAPLGLGPTDVQIDEARIGAALDRILDADVDKSGAELDVSRRARVARFGKDETLLTVATTNHAAMFARNLGRWTRQVDRDPCVLCRGWADGRSRPISVPMARHRGCACIARPVL